MKIVAINGSHSGTKGYTQLLIDRFLKGATNAEATCETIVLSELEVNRCSSCQACTKENHFKRCVYDDKDDVLNVFDEMRDADVIVFATPIYIMNMSGLLKVFLDRIYSTGDCDEFRLSKSGLFFHDIDKELSCTPFVTLICQDNFEKETSKNVTSYFKTYSKFMDAPHLGEIIRRSGGLVGFGKEPEKEKEFPKHEICLQAIEVAGRELVELGCISRKTVRNASKDIIPVPLFSFLKRFRWFKRIALTKIK